MKRIKILLALVLSLRATTVLAQEPTSPPSVPAPAADPSAATPPPAEKLAVSCDLPSLTMPSLLTSIIATEVKAIKTNEVLINRHTELVQAYATKRATYQTCTLRGSGCADPGSPPKEPVLAITPMQRLNKPELMGRIGAWLVCAEIRRTFARDTCLAGNPAQMSTLESDLKSACPFQIGPVKLKGFMGQY